MYYFLDGALRNVGDFLIKDRAIQLIEEFVGKKEIISISRYKDLSDRLDEINNSKGIFLFGGPALVPTIYPEIFKLVENLDNIKVKLYALGLGVYINNIEDRNLYKYFYTDKSKLLFNRIVKDSGFIGCRDFVSLRTLINNNIFDTKMTGCPAWYDLKYLNKNFDNILIKDKIIISLPASVKLINQSVNLIKFIMNSFKGCKIYCTFHRGISSKAENIQEVQYYSIFEKTASTLKSIGCEVVNLEGDSSKMSIYDECSLHIGYRVHAHIYCLSHKIKSFLFYEDGRGQGVDETLSLKGINAFDFSSNNKSENPYVINRLTDIIEESIKTKFIDFEICNYKLNHFFENMKQALSNIPK